MELYIKIHNSQKSSIEFTANLIKINKNTNALEKRSNQIDIPFQLYNLSQYDSYNLQNNTKYEDVSHSIYKSKFYIKSNNQKGIISNISTLNCNNKDNIIDENTDSFQNFQNKLKFSFVIFDVIKNNYNVSPLIFSKAQSATKQETLFIQNQNQIEQSQASRAFEKNNFRNNQQKIKNITSNDFNTSNQENIEKK
ncbi:hypothetical protein ABPG74_005517 [Tetrahymena malaccensis]